MGPYPTAGQPPGWAVAFPGEPGGQSTWPVGQLHWPVVDPDSVAWQPPPGWSSQPPPYYPPPQGGWVQPPPSPQPESEWPPSPGNRRTAGVAAILAGALIIAVIAVGTMVLIHKHGNNPAEASPPSFTVPEPAPVRAVPTVPGWQVVTDGGAAFDVPPDWTIEPGTAPGGGTDNEAVYRKGACGTQASFRARVVQMSDAETDIANGAKNIAQSIVSSYYANDNPRLDMDGAPIPTTDGALQDYPATVSLTPGTSCDPPNAVIHVVAARGDKGGTFAIVVVADQAVPGAADSDDLGKIAMSVRPNS